MRRGMAPWINAVLSTGQTAPRQRGRDASESRPGAPTTGASRNLLDGPLLAEVVPLLASMAVNTLQESWI